MDPASQCEVKVCWPGGSGSVITGLPFLKDHGEQEWPLGLRGVLYMLGLLWLFMGVAIVSDIFMGAIEKITATKKRVMNPATGRYVTVKVWNDTVANLTLMALGSSAPEILLSIIELLTNDPPFTSGSLGPSTIVGSAAFNLFAITAVCVSTIPAGEVRYIKEVSVFAVTAGFSVFAYFWLYIIVAVSTPNYIHWWEGLVTFLLFPVLIVLAYMADIGFFSRLEVAEEGSIKDKDKKTMRVAAMSHEELANIQMTVIQQHGENISDEQLAKLIEMEDQSLSKSRAQYRVTAIRSMTGGKRIAGHEQERRHSLSAVVPTTSDRRGSTGSGKSEDTREVITMHFASAKYAVLESVGTLTIYVHRQGGADTTAYVNYKTRDGTAVANSDYVPVWGTLTFPPGVTTETISIKIIDDTAYEDDEEFFVDLSNPRCDDVARLAVLGEHLATAKVMIVDDDEPGTFSFDTHNDEDVLKVQEGVENKHVPVTVKRKAGSTGSVTVHYVAEEATATKDLDYAHVEGDLQFGNGQMSATIDLTIKPRGRYETEEEFRLILSEPSGGAKLEPNRDGGPEQNILTIVIQPDQEAKSRVDRVMKVIQCDWDKAQIGHANWRDQFRDAFMVNGGNEEGDDDEKPGVLDWVMHITTIFWKVLFACIPPADYCGGWLCFCASLFAIGVVTAFVGDLASMLGCVMKIPDSITAVTFVALGTSLPDTFASKTAAEQDPHADASVGNVTGSNSVNVFLGLGLPWLIGSLYWLGAGRNSVWTDKYQHEDFFPEVNQGFGKFIVKGGADFAFSVGLFTGLAVVAIFLLLLRRRLVGGELGGPTFSKYLTSAVLASMWLLFIILYCIQVLPAKCMDY